MTLLFNNNRQRVSLIEASHAGSVGKFVSTESSHITLFLFVPVYLEHVGQYRKIIICISHSGTVRKLGDHVDHELHEDHRHDGGMARPAGHDSFEPNGELTFIFSIWSQKGHTGADYLLLTFTFSSLIAKKCSFKSWM